MTQQYQQSSSSFRTRDFIAIVLLLYLSFVVYWDVEDGYAQNDDLSALIQFAFFIPRHQYSVNHNGNDRGANGNQNNHTVLLSMLDIDGDDRSEAIAIWSNNNNQHDTESQKSSIWSLRIFDLRSISSTGSKHYRIQKSVQLFSPFQPKIVYNVTEPVTGESVSPYHQAKASEEDEISFYPLAIGTGHILFNINGASSQSDAGKQQKVESETQEQKSDATRYYYCGTDWHDASTRCHQPCPSSTGCPNGERCFADCTSCVVSKEDESGNSNDPQKDSSKKYHYTAAGGWPSICTVWSQGQITMHTITAEKMDAGNVATSKAEAKTTASIATNAAKFANLQLRQLWNVSLVSSTITSNLNRSIPVVELEDVAVSFVDPISSEIVLSRTSDVNLKNNNMGIVLVTGTVTAYYYTDDQQEELDYASFLIAYNAYNGKPIWQTSSSYEMERLLFRTSSSGGNDIPTLFKSDVNRDPLLPLQSLSRSVARRRSGIINHQNANNDIDLSFKEAEQFLRQGTTSKINCLQEYRRSIFTTVGTLPYQYDGTKDNGVKIFVTHFDHQGGSSSNRNRFTPKPGTHSKTYKKGKSDDHRDIKRPHKKYHRSSLEYGRPNVVVVHNYQGINVYALRNGQSLCHISLSDHTLYDDIDHDGDLDSIELTSIGELVDDDEMIKERNVYDEVAKRLAIQNITDSVNGKNDIHAEIDGILPSCHKLLVSSGYPSKELKFSNPLSCHQEEYMRGEILNAPILLVDTMDTYRPTGSDMNRHYRRYKDIIIAFNNGVVSRLNGKHGYWMWQKRISEPMIGGNTFSVSTKNYPTWSDHSIVTFKQLTVDYNEGNQHGQNPILLVGENSMVLLSSTTGRVLTSAVLPQPSTIQQPYIIDINDDGTSDIIVVTKDVIWGYTILIHNTGGGIAVAYRIIFSFLLFGLMIAYLCNRFGPHPGKRSTDR